MSKKVFKDAISFPEEIWENWIMNNLLTIFFLRTVDLANHQYSFFVQRTLLKQCPSWCESQLDLLRTLHFLLLVTSNCLPALIFPSFGKYKAQAQTLDRLNHERQGQQEEDCATSYRIRCESQSQTWLAEIPFTHGIWRTTITVALACPWSSRKEGRKKTARHHNQ